MLLDSELKRVDKKLIVNSDDANQADTSEALPALLLRHAGQNGNHTAAFFSTGTLKQ